MSDTLSRRTFVRTAAAAGVAAALPAPASGALSALARRDASAPGAPVVLARRAIEPLVISDVSGIRYRNGGPQSAVEKAYEMIVGGSDVLDALIEGVNIPELDPEETGIGYGGLPNADGVVQLDASVMHGPLRRAGAVAAIEGVRTPSKVARAVADLTDHHLLVGGGAREFARQLGFAVEDDLNTPESRRLWLEWRRRVDPEHWLDPEARLRVGLDMVDEGLIPAHSFWGTINCNGIYAAGDICGVTTTSGLAWKIPGRVGDSPILGAGLYVDNDVGAAGSTGRGEANLYNLSSFLIVEEMRRGAHPKDAAMTALERIRQNTVERRLLDDQGRPAFNVRFFALNKKGEYAGCCLLQTEEAKFAVADRDGAREETLEALLD